MSIQVIQKYYAEIDRIKRYSGASNESSLRKAFQDLLEQYARGRYRLGTYSALEWILERYKESVIELLRRVCTVSVETMKIVKEMPE